MNKFEKIIKNVSSGKNWFNVLIKDETPEIYIYDTIGTDMFGDGLAPRDFVEQLKELEKDYTAVNIHINSPGGFVHDGLVIYNQIKSTPLVTSIFIDGLAASAAAFIAMAGDKVVMAENSQLMIHNAWSMVAGNKEELREEADRLNSLDEMIINIFATKTGLERENVAELMTKETWLNGQEAANLKFIDQIDEGAKAAACAFDLDADLLPNLPTGFVKYQNALKKREQEKSLRDAGASRNSAKAELSDTKQRDAVDEKIINKLIIEELNKCLK